MLRVDLDPLAVNLATKGLVWQKSSVWMVYGCLGKSVHGSILIEVGLAPGAGWAGVDIRYLLFSLIKNYINSDIYFFYCFIYMSKYHYSFTILRQYHLNKMIIF